jgi:hypothetical protein
MDQATPSTTCANILHCALELSKKSCADVIGNTVHVMRIATGQIRPSPQDHFRAADFGATNSA